MNIVFILRFYFVFFPKILWFSNEDLYMAVRTFLIICKRFNVVLNRAFIWAIETNPITFPSSQQYSKSINQCKLSNTSIPAVAFKKMLYIYILWIYWLLSLAQEKPYYSASYKMLLGAKHWRELQGLLTTKPKASSFANRPSWKKNILCYFFHFSFYTILDFSLWPSKTCDSLFPKISLLCLEQPHLCLFNCFKWLIV